MKKKRKNWRTDKFNWESALVPRSVSVCSNVPGYETPKCFVTDGDANGLMSEFIQYLVSISTKSSTLLREQYADVFEALKTESRESHEDRLAQMLIELQEGQQTESEQEEESEDQSRDIDLMAGDNEDDEEEIVSLY